MVFESRALLSFGRAKFYASMLSLTVAALGCLFLMYGPRYLLSRQVAAEASGGGEPEDDEVERLQATCPR